ncbi:MAG: magnesium transporter [Defluviitaleaceae bacterium]|nr:magnesium transporter [Defluviitaleaceae bacterium]
MQEIILTHIKNKDMNALKNMLAAAEEMEILYAFHNLNAEEQVIVFRLLSKDRVLSLFEELDTDMQQNLLRSFTEDGAIEFVNELAPDDRVRLLDELPAGVATKLINALSPEERESTNLLMGYAPETAGRIMTTEYISLQRDFTVEQALDKISAQAEDKETVYTLFVTDEAKRLEGVITLKGLIIARGVTGSTIGKTDGNTLIGDIMSKNSISVHTGTDQEEVARILQELDLLAIPVVDSEHRIVGIVTIDDAIDILEEEATEDIFDAAGFADIAGKETDRSEVLTKGSLLKIWAVRLPFLVITLAAGMAAGLILEGFEEILESVVVVAFFIPLIMDIGGTVGTQSSTVFARGVVLGHININHFLKPFLKEFGVGLSMGAVIGAVAGTVISIWLGIPMLGIAVGISIVSTMTLAAVLGFLVPYVLIKLKADQAAGSAPIITSLKDISGLFIYFGLIVLLMSGYLEPSYEVTGKFVTVDGIHFFVDLKEEEATVIQNEPGAEIPYEITIGDETFPVIGIDDGALRMRTAD